PGGDESAGALVETEGTSAGSDLIRRMRIHLAPARRHFGLPREFGISYGSAVYAVDGETVEELLFAADAGLYRAKGQGRGELMVEAGHSPTLEKVRVLVADDDAGVRALCAAVLEEAGFDVTCVPDGVSAIKAAKESIPDIALIDVTMPHLDGWRVLDELSADDSTQHVPVVMLTGSADEANLDKAWKGGALDFINKPFDPEGLVASVHRVLEYDEESQRTTAPAA
ncbi:MAG: response regulator, partial [Thermoleophilia bacterium]|nr:response regulator [Thermoleophilia bacterium]